jgi:hypothetical protein
MKNYTNSGMVFCYRSADGVGLRSQALYREKFPARRLPHSLTFLTVIQRLRENGTFPPRSVDRRQEGTPQLLELEPHILETGRKTRQQVPGSYVVREFQVSQFVVRVCRNLREQGLHPYHVQRVQALQPNDYIRRKEFSEWAIQKCVDQPDLLRICTMPAKKFWPSLSVNSKKKCNPYFIVIMITVLIMNVIFWIVGTVDGQIKLGQK